MNLIMDISSELEAKLAERAQAAGLAVDAYVAKLLDEAMAETTDPFLADNAVVEEQGPTDVALKHDDYLYGEAS